MSDTFYFFWQATAKTEWIQALASERERIIREQKPELCTILDVNQSFDGDLTQEEKAKIRRSGPAYFDFDSSDLEEVIPSFQEFLTNLRVKGCNLDALRIYCSGGKGFHIEMPAAMLQAKVPPQGSEALPLIYKEVAHSLYVNTLDLRVYSQGRGRMWRNPNVLRENGNYKVQITAEEALCITPERYLELIAHPRPLFPVEQAIFVPDLGLLYAKARDKVEGALRNRKKKKATGKELTRFKGEWPETIKSILSGQGLKDNVGWNYVAIQLCLTAVELGKTEDQLIRDAQGLLNTYSGDSSRYGTPRKREAELRDKYRYFSENPCYEFSVGGILSMVTKEAQTETDLNLGDYVPDGTEPEPESEEEEAVEQSQAVRVNTTGIYSKTENGWKNISHLGLSNPVMLIMPTGKKHIGYDVDVYVDSVLQGRHLLTKEHLMTKTTMHNYASGFNASFRGNDTDAANLLDHMRKKVQAKSKVALVTQVEGIDLILPPDAESEDELELIWASPTEVISMGKRQYTFRPLSSQDGTYKSDLYKAESLSNSEADRQMIADLLSFNTPQNLARILGWFGATFVCPILRRNFSQFPLLQIYGGASAGKSKTIALLSHLHYHQHKPRIIQSSGITQYPLLVAASASNSIPLIIEELRYKFLKAGGKWEMMINILKSNFDGHGMARGALGDRGGSPVVNDFANTAPIAFVAEEMNGEVAVQERCVSVCMSQADRLGRDEPYTRLKANASSLGRLGKSMLQMTLSMKLNEFVDEFVELHDQVSKSMGKAKDGKERPIYNLAVTLVGLELMRRAVEEDLKTDEFNERFQAMADSVLGNVSEFVPHNMSEASRVLDTMAQMSKLLDIQYKLEHGREYTVARGGRTVDIKLKPAYAKYMKYVRNLGSQPLYESDQAFIAAMSRYDGMIKAACPDNPSLFDNPFEPIYRFSVDHFEKEQIEPFKD